MKSLLLLTAFYTGAVFANCSVKESSQMVRDVATGAPTNIVRTVKDNSCHVKFNIEVDGKVHAVEYNLTKSDNCAEAIERGKNELIVTMAGKYRVESITTCKEGGTVDLKPVKIGEVVLETELGVVERASNYFRHNNSKCRLFRERYGKDGKLRVAHGVICQMDNQGWIVVDKW